MGLTTFLTLRVSDSLVIDWVYADVPIISTPAPEGGVHSEYKANLALIILKDIHLYSPVIGAAIVLIGGKSNVAFQAKHV